MRCVTLPSLGLMSAVLLLAAGLTLAEPQKLAVAAEGDKLFRDTVLPVLKDKCFACHGDDAKKIKANLDLRSREGMLKGGDSGQAVLAPGEPLKSRLYIAVSGRASDLNMPPKENDRLSSEQKEAIHRWIALGAPWPREKKAETTTADWNSPDGIIIPTSGGRSPEWTNRKYKPEDVWAYRPVQRPEVPASGHPIDAFLQARLKAKGISQTAPPADRRTLIRRATFDLTGLPPTPEEIDAFVADQSVRAYERLLDRLLMSPHYGERWAQHWLDVVRYADTAGFSNDFERPAAWRYRDYVIRAFNQDRPFDRFVREQIAGDELDPSDPEMLIAAGFLRMGPWEHTGMSVAAVTRQHFLDDVTHSVGVTFLGQGLRCASCHDHKFDPLPTKDYYRLQAVFAGTQFAEREVAFLPSENITGFSESQAVVQRRLQKAKDEVERIRKKSDDAIAAYLKERGIARLADLPDTDRPKRLRFGLNDQELSVLRISQKRVEHFDRELLRYQPYAYSVYNGAGNNYISNKPINAMPARREGALQAVHILPGGSLETPTEAVTPGVLSAVAGSNDAIAPSAWNTIPETTEGRRLALANWIASPNNPLTARVIVNRVWQHHFGRGLVATPNNFGKMGKRPSHPELLDWLATWFIEHGWSIKKLHVLIMTSAAYQQSRYPPLSPSEGEGPGVRGNIQKLKQADPSNELLAYFPSRRLSAEEIRDALLAVTGELNREVGGPGVFPELNWEVALQPRHVMGSVAPAYQPSPLPAQRNRRTIYAFRHRTLADPMQEVFNRPGSETACESRDQTTVTPQVFALFNGEFAHDRALALAAALEKTAKDSSDLFREAFRRCYGREPSEVERLLCEEHLAKMTAYHRQHPPTATELPTRVKRKMVEEMTGEEYEWDEELDGMAGYVRDLKPWQVKPETRALADLCLVLMNANEFLYVR